jgi:hypothetical protein
MGQSLSNESKFVKIVRLEPEIWVDKEIAAKWKIYISKLKPVKDIERLIKNVLTLKELENWVSNSKISCKVKMFYTPGFLLSSYGVNSEIMWWSKILGSQISLKKIYIIFWTIFGHSVYSVFWKKKLVYFSEFWKIDVLT